MYVFIEIDKSSISGIVGCTKSKKIAKDYYDINKWRYNMCKISDEDFNIASYPGIKISYYTLIGDDGEKYIVPLSENDAKSIVNKCIHIRSIFIFAKYELITDNKYNIRKKYLNIIKDLTSILTGEDYRNDLNTLFDQSTRTIDSFTNINSLKIYNDICKDYKKSKI